MPGKVKVKVLAGRNLPVMDRGSDTTDAYVEIKIGNVTHKTDVCRKSLNPQWNTDWYRFEVDDAELQDEPLQIRLMDYDTYSANDAIGKVYISLHPLLLSPAPVLDNHAIPITHSGKGGVMSGWIPVFDTMHGIRGEVNVIVKVELFSDVNKFRQSSCGVHFFHSPIIPHGYHAQVIHGFVDELVVNDDPEYQWIDKIRTPRASNEARQVVFLKLSGQVQRKIGLKALDLGANAVIGYTQCFDLEADVGVVARGVGTAVTLVKLHDNIAHQPNTNDPAQTEEHALKYLDFLAADRKATNKSLQELFGSMCSQASRDNYFKTKIKPISHNKFAKHSRHKNIKQRKKSAIILHKHKVIPHKIILPDVNPVFDEAKHESEGIAFGNKLSRRFITSKNIFKKKMNALKAKLSDGNIDKGNDTDLSKNSSYSDISLESSSHSLSNDGNKLKSNHGFFKKPRMNKVLARSVAKVHSSLQSITESHGNRSCSSTIATTPDKSKLIKNIDSTVVEHNKFIEETTPTIETNKIDDKYNNELIEITDNSSSPSSQSSSSSDCDELQENISDVYKIDQYDYPEDNIDTIVKAVLAQRQDQPQVDNTENIPQAEVMNKSEVVQPGTSEEDLKTSESLNNASEILGNPHNSIPRFSFNFGSIARNVSFSAPTSPYDDNISTDNNMHKKGEHKFQRLLQRVGLSLHTAPITEKHFDFDQRKHSKRTSEADLLHVHNKSSYLASARRSFQIGLSNTKKPELLHADGLIGTAMQTILMDKVNIMGEILDDDFVNREPPNNDINEPRNHFKSYDARRSVTRETVLGSPFLSIADLTQGGGSFNPSTRASMSCLKEDTSSLTLRPAVKRQRSFSLFETAVETILIDKVNAIMITPHSTPPQQESSMTSVTEPDALLSALPNALQKINTDIYDNNVCKFVQWDDSSDINVDASSSTSRELINNSSNVNISDSCNRFSCSPPLLSKGTTDGGVSDSLKTNLSLHDIPVFSTLCSDRIGSPVNKPQQTHHRTESVGAKAAQSPVKQTHGLNINNSHRRSSDSDLSITPKGNSVERASRAHTGGGLLRPSMHQDNIDLLEYPFLTIAKYPPGFILHLGGTVAARSVKLLERVPNPDEPETRDTWWTELRMEIRSHARALACNVVLGYSENTTISDDICVLSATGTAAVINLNYNPAAVDTNLESINQPRTSQGPNQNTLHGPKELMTTSLDRPEFDKDAKQTRHNEKENMTKSTHHSHSLEQPDETSPKISNPSHVPPSACSICHIPYSKASVPFRVKMIKCAVCRRGKVPNVLFCTVEVPERLQVTGRGCLVQAHVLKPKRDLRSEMNAREISDSLPFLEYELHRLLISKLKVKGMNAIFGLKATVAIGERMIAAVATGTAVYLTALPPPCIPTVISGNSWKDLPRLAELQRAMQDTLDTNRDVYQLNPTNDTSEANKTNPSDTEDSDEELADLDLGAGNKDACIIEVDDTEDLEMLSLLMEPRPPDGFHVVNTQAVPGLQGLEVIRNLQTFVQVWRAKLPHSQANTSFPKHFQRLLQSVYFKLRSMIPCAVCDLRFRLDLPEPDELQLLVTGMALGLGEPVKYSHTNKKLTYSLSKDGVQRDDDMIFSLEEEQSTDMNGEVPSPMQEKLKNLALLRNKTSGLSLSRHLPVRERYGVDITPLSYVPGGRIDRYLGNLNFFFIRESTSIRENGGISGFVHGFITEILAVVRAHATALGGNAMVAYYMTELILVDNLHKNQGQCIVSVGGDVVFVSYFTDE